ncbi:MAG: SDR family oxidoreductase [Anaerolineae bacterium]|nr:SDR family oxidoreductase [Anaerolineae bacterium]
MKTILITGSTRGIGFGLANSFLDLGCAVVVCGRKAASVAQAVASLAAKHDPARIFGQACDMTDFAQVQALWDAAQAHFGQVDIWINNAGLNSPIANFWELPAGEIHAVVQANLVGAMYGAKVALSGMLAQGFGALYNMEGSGSDGTVRHGMTLYGSTKRGLNYLTDALAQEVKDTPLLVGAISPGMVITDMLGRDRVASDEEWQRVKRVFNILADKTETVTPWLAQRVLANTSNGVTISWLTKAKIIGRFLSAPFSKRDLFS